MWFLLQDYFDRLCCSPVVYPYCPMLISPSLLRGWLTFCIRQHTSFLKHIQAFTYVCNQNDARSLLFRLIGYLFYKYTLQVNKFNYLSRYAIFLCFLISNIDFIQNYIIYKDFNFTYKNYDCEIPNKKL
jgi:hypothetical protein